MDIEKEIRMVPLHGTCCNGHLLTTWKTIVGPTKECYECLRSSRNLAVGCSLPLAPSSHLVSPTRRGAESRNRSLLLLLAALLGTVGPMCQHSTSRALETTLSLREAVFCFVWLQQVAWITPFCRLHSSAPQGTEAGLGHCDFTRLSYSPSLCFWVCCHKQTDTIHLSLKNTPTKSLANSDLSFFPSLSQSLGTPSQIRDQMAMTSCLVAGGNETTWTWFYKVSLSAVFFLCPSFCCTISRLFHKL